MRRKQQGRIRAVFSATPRWIARVAVILLAGAPVAVFLTNAFRGLFGVEEWMGVFNWPLAVRSFAIAASAAVISVMLGVPAGLAASRLRRGWPGVVFFIFLMPLALAPAIHAYIWRNLALETGLLGMLFVEGGAAVLNFCGAVLSLVGAYWTIPALAAFAVARSSGRRCEMEARVFAPAGLAARKILLPMMRPVAAAAGGLVFILAFSDYGAAAAWQMRTFGEHVISLYGSLSDLGAASAAGLAPAAVTLVVAAALYPAARRTIWQLDSERTPRGIAGLWRPPWWLKLTLAGELALLVGVPAGASAYYAFSGGLEAAVVSPVITDMGWTALVALSAAAAASAVALAAAATHWTTGGAWRALILWTAAAAFVIPGAGYGLAMITVSRWGAVPPAFSAGSGMLVWTLCGRFMVVPLLLTTVFFAMFDRRLGDMQRLSGRRSWRELFRVGLPLGLPAAVAGCAAAAVLGVGELAIASLLAPPGAQPVSVHLFNLMHYARTGEAFAAGLLMMVGGAGAVGIVLLSTAGLWKRYLPQA